VVSDLIIPISYPFRHRLVPSRFREEDKSPIFLSQINSRWAHLKGAWHPLGTSVPSGWFRGVSFPFGFNRQRLLRPGVEDGWPVVHVLSLNYYIPDYRVSHTIQSAGGFPNGSRLEFPFRHSFGISESSPMMTNLLFFVQGGKFSDIRHPCL
jgi:hypothetical protein